MTSNRPTARWTKHVEVWGPKGLSPQQYYCTGCSVALPLGCRAGECMSCISKGIAKLLVTEQENRDAH